MADDPDFQPAQGPGPPPDGPPDDARDTPSPEAGALEAGASEAGASEAGAPEAGASEAGVSEAGALEAGLPETAALARVSLERLSGERLVAAGPPTRRRRPPGPGLFESLLWTIGVPVVHLAAVLGLVIAIAVAGELLSASLNLENLFAPGEGFMTSVLLGGEMLVFVIVAVTAVTLRLGPQPARKLALNGFCVPHAMIMIGLVLPLSVVSGELYRLTNVHVWQPLVEVFPLLSMLDNANTMESISSLAGQMPLAALLLCLAVAPAIGEEVVCRGLIGRGLIARWGLPGGVACTTLLFAAIHLHPVHAVGVIPLGLCMHVLYVATRSFWAPVCYHFLNNAWGCWMLSEQAPDEPAVADGVSLTAVILASGCILSLVGLLWQTRVRYILPDGADWTPGYTSLERPPVALGLMPSRRPAAPVWVLASLLTIAAFVYWS